MTGKLSLNQACSKWVNKFVNDFILNNNYNSSTIRFITYDYIRLVDFFKSERAEDVVVSMLKNNNSLIKYFGSKEKAKEEVNKNFRNNRCINEFIEDLGNFITDSIEFSDKNKTEIIQNRNRIKLNQLDKIDRIYNTGVLDFDYVKDKFFYKNTPFWKVKEAISWMVAYIENFDYNLSDIIEYKGDFVDKNKTFKNIITAVNNHSITAQNPFSFKKNQQDKILFTDAKSGEIDVMLFNPKNLQIISASATRDRGYHIEGNQFIRHFIKSVILQEAIIKNYEEAKSRIEKENVDMKKIYHYFFTNKSLRKKINSESIENNLSFKKALSSNCTKEVQEEISNGNVFAKDLTLLRENIYQKLKTNFHKNGLNITSTEISSILAYSKQKVDFMFFGENLKDKHLSTVQCGLNCLAYRDNFKKISKFRMVENSSNVFMRSIKKRFNNVSPSENNVESYGQQFMIDFINNYQNKNFSLKTIQYFSEGNAYSEDRACLFKSFDILFKNILSELNNERKNIQNHNNLDSDKVIDKAIENGIKFFFDQGISKEKIETLKDFFKDNEKIEDFIILLETIKPSNSEVTFELNDLDNSKDNIITAKDAIILELKNKELILELKGNNKLKQSKRKTYKK